MSYSGDLTYHVKCPMVGQSALVKYPTIPLLGNRGFECLENVYYPKAYCQITTIAPPVPERGVVGEYMYIDRCISDTYYIHRLMLCLEIVKSLEGSKLSREQQMKAYVPMLLGLATYPADFIIIDSQSLLYSSIFYCMHD